jgi:hypothetical protein
MWAWSRMKHQWRCRWRLSLSSSTGRSFFFFVTKSKCPSAEPELHQHVCYTAAISPAFRRNFFKATNALSQCHLVCIATSYGLDGQESIPGIATFFSSTASIQTLGPTQLPVQWVLRAVSSWPLTSIQCRSQEWWSYISTSPYVFMTWCLIKQWDSFTLTSASTSFIITSPNCV